MHKLPETGFLRLSGIIGNPKADPPIPAVIPVSKSSWWKGVAEGRYGWMSLSTRSKMLS
jgi:prophage regulatory protein